MSRVDRWDGWDGGGNGARVGGRDDRMRWLNPHHGLQNKNQRQDSKGWVESDGWVDGSRRDWLERNRTRH